MKNSNKSKKTEFKNPCWECEFYKKGQIFVISARCKKYHMLFNNINAIKPLTRCVPNHNKFLLYEKLKQI